MKEMVSSRKRWTLKECNLLPVLFKPETQVNELSDGKGSNKRL